MTNGRPRGRQERTVMALRLSQEEFTRGVQTYSRDMYRAARALTPCDADAQDA